MYTLLIVDDEALIRRGLSKIIPWGEMGYELVSAVGNAQEALELFSLRKIDVLLTDISMPEMNGLELIEKAREYNEGVKSIVISGYSEFDYALEAIQLKVENYILKPLDPDKITDIFRKLKVTLDREREEHARIQNMQSGRLLFPETDQNLEQLVLTMEEGSPEEVKKAAERILSDCRNFYSSHPDAYQKAVLEKVVRYFRLEESVLSELQTFSVLDSDDGNELRKENQQKKLGQQKEPRHLEELKQQKTLAQQEELRNQETAFEEDLCSILMMLQENSEALAIRVSYQARQYVNAHYSDKELSLRQVADRLHVSYGYLSTAFTRTFGENFKSYVVNVRTEKARELLLERKYKVYEIADMVGYGSSRYFTDAFKKKYGVSPADYINRHRKGDSRK